MRKIDPIEFVCIKCSLIFYHKNPPSRPRKFCGLVCQRAYALEKGHIRTYSKGKDHPMWLGDNVGYDGIHHRIYKELGAPCVCEICKTTESKRFMWHNISGDYKIDLKDWQRVCARCHSHIHKAWEGRWGRA